MWATLVAQGYRICLPMQRCGHDPWVRKIAWRRNEEMAIHSSILAWRIPWPEEAGGLQSMGSLRIRHNLMTEHRNRYIGLHSFRNPFLLFSSF